MEIDMITPRGHILGGIIKLLYVVRRMGTLIKHLTIIFMGLDAKRADTLEYRREVNASLQKNLLYKLGDFMETVTSMTG
jgi:hypothetical protein